jgi:hypothetical protein
MLEFCDSGHQVLSTEVESELASVLALRAADPGSRLSQYRVVVVSKGGIGDCIRIC